MNNAAISREKITLGFLLDPYSKNEAWSWLLERITSGDVSISIRQMAYIWKWHKSKVERFIALLKKEAMIETKICARKLVISQALKPTLENRSCGTKTSAGQEQNCELYTQDTKHDSVETSVSQEQPALLQSRDPAIETESRRKQDNLPDHDLSKKEKNQKKENFEVILIKEKNTPYGSTKKENYALPLPSQDEVQKVMPEDVDEFANKLGIDYRQLAWELEKFKDYWLTSRKDQPKDGAAAFRNWLRKSIEFSKERGDYERFNKTRTKNAGFEHFIAAGNRAITEYEGSRLDGKIEGSEPDLFAGNSHNYQGFKSISTVNQGY